jgi:ankyrin repeat protein
MRTGKYAVAPEHSLDDILARLEPLIRRGHEDIPWLEGQRISPLLAATLAEDIDAITALVHEHGFELEEETGRYHRTAAQAAARHGKALSFACLMNLGANITNGNSDGYTPAHCSASKGHANILALLAKHPKCNLSQPDNDGSTPAHQAAINGHLDCLQVLIDQHTPMSAVNDFGRTPLLDAERCDHEACAALLRKAQCGSPPGE